MFKAVKTRLILFSLVFTFVLSAIFTLGVNNMLKKVQAQTTTAVTDGYYYIQVQTIGSAGIRNVEYPGVTDGLGGTTAAQSQLKATLPEYNNNNINQQWELTLQNDGTYRIRPRANLSDETTSGASVEAADGSIIKTWRNPTHTATRGWSFENIENEENPVYKILNLSTGTVFDADNNGLIYHTAYSKKNSQHFKLIPVFEAEGTPVNFMAYNLYFNVSQIAARAPRLKAVIDKYNPDVIGFSEVVPAWVTELSGSNYSDKYELLYRFRGGPEISAKEGTAILYNKSKYTLSVSGHYWLSGTPHVESNTFGSAHHRIVVWAKLMDNTTKAEFYFHSVHADYLTAVQVNEAQIMIDIAKTHGDADVIFGGDFNYSLDTAPYNHFISYMVDPRNTVRIYGDLRSTVPLNSNFHNSIIDDALTGEFIDHFFTTSAVDCVYYTVMYDTPLNGYVSDHYGIYMQTFVGLGEHVITHTLEYDSNTFHDVSGMPLPNSCKVVHGTTIQEDAVPKRNGYVFMGWADSSSKANQYIASYLPNSSITVNSDLTLYAVWGKYISVPDGTYYIRQTANSVEQSLQYTGTVNEQFIMTYPDESTAQQWVFEIQTNGSYRIRPAANLNSAIDNKSGSGMIKTCSNTALADNMGWYLVDIGDDAASFTLVNNSSSTVFEINSNNVLINGMIQRGSGQVFTLININASHSGDYKTPDADNPKNFIGCNCVTNIFNGTDSGSGGGLNIVSFLTIFMLFILKKGVKNKKI